MPSARCSAPKSSVRRAPCKLGIAAVLALAAVGCGGSPKPVRHGAPTDDADHSVGDAESLRPPATPEVARAEQSLAAGKGAEAKKALLAETAAHPDDARAFYDLGMAHEALGEVKEAMHAYAKASELAPRFPEPLNNLGVILRASGNVEKALPLFERAVRADPNFIAAEVNLALARTDTGDIAGAKAAYARAVELSPDDAMVRANYGQVLLEAGDTEGARSEFRRVLTDMSTFVVDAPQPTDDRAATYQTIGNGLRRAGDAEGAVQAMESAIAAREHGPTPALLAEYSLAQRGAGDREGAEKSLRSALTLDEKYAIAHYLLGNTLAGNGQFGDAAKHYQRYLELEPTGDQAAAAKERLEVCRQQAAKNPGASAEQSAPVSDAAAPKAPKKKKARKRPKK